ncbi:hypothetical protein M758_1G050100 [Ceratodon purpureus]|nr:hypothetical protein M758_1G050100 [Ceratodon purpureus]
MKTLVLMCVLASVFAGIAVASESYDGPGYPGGGNHPPGVGKHPPGVGRHGPAWSQWRAYRALQAWKKAITEDPEHILDTWVGPDVCNYTGVFCSPPEDPELAHLEVVAGIDLNGADLKGCLVPELGLLREISLFHLNSNRFFGTVPETFKYMKTLFELDLSNNKFSGTFPDVVLEIPNLEFLDIRFNKFYGKLPRELFAKPLDAIFLNNNNFDGELPDSFGHSNSSAIVLANNNLHGNIPKSISNLKDTLQEIVALNNNFHGTLPSNIGDLENVHLFDYSDNRIGGGLPSSIKDMSALETFVMSKNRLSGRVTAQLCSLDHLSSVILDDNYFNGVDPSCARLGDIISLKGNCLPGSGQKSSATCAAFYPASPESSPPRPVSSPPPPPISSPPPPISSPPPPPVSSPPPPVSSPPPPVASPPPPVASPPPPPTPSPPPSPSRLTTATTITLSRGLQTGTQLRDMLQARQGAEEMGRSRIPLPASLRRTPSSGRRLGRARRRGQHVLQGERDSLQRPRQSSRPGLLPRRQKTKNHPCNERMELPMVTMHHIQPELLERRRAEQQRRMRDVPGGEVRIRRAGPESGQAAIHAQRLELRRPVAVHLRLEALRRRRLRRAGDLQDHGRHAGQLQLRLE